MNVLYTPPLLDEKEFREIGIVVLDALYHALKVRIVYWQDGKFKEVVGIIDQLDLEEKWIKINTINNKVEYVPTHYLKNVERLD